jgi:hypothetical protein
MKEPARRHPVPDANKRPEHPSARIQPHRRAHGDAAPAFSFDGRSSKQRPVRAGIRVDKQDPIPGCRRRTGIARSANLVDRLKHYLSACRTGQVRSPVSGIVVANHHLGAPPALGKTRQGRLHGTQGGRQ